MNRESYSCCSDIVLLGGPAENAASKQELPWKIPNHPDEEETVLNCSRTVNMELNVERTDGLFSGFT